MISSRAYYTVLQRDADGTYYDVYGDYSRAACKREVEYLRHDSGLGANEFTIIETDGSATQLVTALEKINAK